MLFAEVQEVSLNAAGWTAVVTAIGAAILVPMWREWLAHRREQRREEASTQRAAQLAEQTVALAKGDNREVERIAQNMSEQSQPKGK